MKEVSIKYLREHLSALLSAATKGERVLITKHSRAVALLSPVVEAHTHVGERIGRGGLSALFSKPATGGKYLEILADDRRDSGRRAHQ